MILNSSPLARRSLSGAGSVAVAVSTPKSLWKYSAKTRPVRRNSSNAQSMLTIPEMRRSPSRETRVPTDVGAQHGGTKRRSERHSKQIVAVVASRHEFHLARAEDSVPQGGVAVVAGAPARVAPGHMEQLQRAVRKCAFDHQDIVPWLVVPIHRRRRKGIEQVHGLEHVAAAPAHRLAPHRNRETRIAVLDGKTVEAMDGQVSRSLIYRVCQVHQPAGVFRRPLVQPRGIAKRKGIARYPGQGIVADETQPASTSTHQHPQVGIVIVGWRPALTALRVSRRQRGGEENHLKRKPRSDSARPGFRRRFRQRRIPTG